MKELLNTKAEDLFPGIRNRVREICLSTGLPAARAHMSIGNIGSAADGVPYFFFRFTKDHRKFGASATENDLEYCPAKVTLEEALEEFAGVVERFAGASRDEGVKKLALELVRFGQEATEAKLRGAGFSQDELDAWGLEAEAEAEKLAQGGPFKIVRGRGRNEPVEGIAAKAQLYDEIPF